MFRLEPGIKSNPVKRRNLPERVFFACGCCHIPGYAFLETYPEHDSRYPGRSEAERRDPS